MSPRPTVVVAGNGMVGHRFCSALTDRARGRYRVVVLGEEPRPAYDRTRLTDLLGDRTLDDLVLSPQAWYERRGIELRLGDPVASIDRAGRTLRTRNGRIERYDHLILATGAAPRVPPIVGRDLPGVMLYRSAGDLAAIARRAERSSSVAVLGGGPLGIEAGLALRRLGLHTVLLEAADQLAARQLDPESAALVTSELEKAGVQVNCGVSLRAIRRSATRLVVEIAGWPPLPVDMVVLATGVRARDELALKAGLAVDHTRGGVAVDDQLMTSDPHIRAIGDCVSHIGRTYGTVAPGYEMAEVCADRLAGGKASFGGAPPALRLRTPTLEFVAIGEPPDPAEGEVVVYGGPRRRRRLTLRDGVVVSVQAVGTWPELPEVEQVMLEGRPLTPGERSRFRDSGAPFARGSIQMQAVPVCHCENVSYLDVRAARDAGCTTVEALEARTGAGSRCGGCRPRLEEILGVGTLTPVRVRGRAALALISLAALALIGGLGAALASGLRADLLRHLEAIRVPGQIASGVALAGTAALALVLSLRRRVRALRWGQIAWYRVFHALVGVASIGLCAAHTQLRLGHNLNRALLACFLSVLVTGAAFGITTAAAATGGPLGFLLRALHPLARVTHWLALWALPVLLAFHVLAVFYF